MTSKNLMPRASKSSASSVALAAETEPNELVNSNSQHARYVLHLYVTATTPQSMRAIANVRKLCEEHLPGRYDLVVINIVEQPTLAVAEQIIAVPTLIKKQPLPMRRFIGDMSQTERILLGFDLLPAH